ncbi:unnamed protein product, partial [marine sediment metagenome]
DELKKYEVIWPLRFEFDVDFCLPPDKWVGEKIVSKELWPRSGFQLLDQTTAKTLVSLMGKAEYVSKDTAPLSIAAPATEYVGVTETVGKSLPSHKELQTKLVEIGKLQNYLAEPEYSCDLGRLDVVWRRVTKSVPTYVFEIQVGGDIYQALAKLKDAFDLWNSHIFIVAPESERRKVNNLLSGAFHEIGSRINFIELEQVDELYQRKKNYKDFERELGI